MYNKLFFSLFIVLMIGLSLDTLGQSSIDDDDESVDMIIFKDPRIDYLSKIYAFKKAPKKDLSKIYRIQILSTKSRDEANNTKNQFAGKFPGIPAFLTYDPPVFKLRVGNFSTMQDATSFKKQIQSSFPYSFVVEN
jgi:hypothetical protein